MIASSITQLIGKTPMVRMNRFADMMNADANIIAKLEYFNPGGSAKDRIALAMIEDAEKKGLIRPCDTIIEPTSGNTGIGLALVSAAKGYKLILTMPETMSIERRMLLSAYGAKIELTPGKLGMKGAIERANQLKESISGAIILGQFDNPANPAAHYATTAAEIINDCGNHTPVDFFVAGVGTGGTISGTGRRLKEAYPNVKIVAVEPAKSPVLSGGKAGPHSIQGIGAGFVPKNYDPTLIDEILCIDDDQAFEAARMAARHEGVLVGISSGAALYASTIIANRKENQGKNIVVILPDSGERYLSTGLYSK